MFKNDPLFEVDKLLLLKGSKNMDFLDPRKRRAHKIRLIIGYVLVAIAIVLATVILVYDTNGFSITKNGQVIQNGLLFVDSQPGGAKIYLNNQPKNANTASRLILPAGDYTLTLKKSGYRDWQRAFTLEASSVSRFVYPFLFPQSPRVTNLGSYSSIPPLFTQSPDRRWLLVQLPDKPASFDMFDTNNLTKAPQEVTVPTSLLTGKAAIPAQLSVAEWSSDNNNVLLKHTYAGGSEFVVFNRAKPETSFNVNKTFNSSLDQVALFNKKVSQLYVYDQSAQTISLATVSNGKLGSPILSNVLAFKPYGTDLISYITDKSMPSGMVQARIWQRGKTYPLYTFVAGSVYLIDTAQYAGHWYYVAGDNAENKVNIYEDPLSGIQNTSIGKAVPTIALNVVGASKLSFSDNARFIEIENGQAFSVYDIETQSKYQYRLKAPLDTSLTWMDGHRLIGRSNKQFFVTDYDSTNQQLLLPTADLAGGLFSRDYNHLLTFQTKAAGGYELVNADMRAGADLPKIP